MRDWLPSAQDVGAVLRARTKTDAGDEIGTFNDDTRPTREQVEALSELAVERIQAKVGDVPDGKQPLARRVASIGTALLVELSYFPEQIETGRSPYTQLKALYDELMEALIEAVQNDDSDETTIDSPVGSAHSYPDNPYQVRLTSVW